MSGLSGKIVVVTGASSGIGKAIALKFAAEGAVVVLLSRREKELQKVRRQIQSEGGTSFVVAADLSKSAAIARSFDKIRRTIGAAEILVNNAGVGSFGKSVVECGLKEYEATFAVNLRAVFLATKAVLPAMIKSRKGTIINIGSTYGKRGYPRSAFYCASKFALEGFSQALQEEVNGHNVRVCLISPERVRIEGLGTKRPIKGNLNNYIRVEDVAEAAVFCAQESPTATVREIIINHRRPI